MGPGAAVAFSYRVDQIANTIAMRSAHESAERIAIIRTDCPNILSPPSLVSVWPTILSIAASEREGAQTVELNAKIRPAF